MTDEHEPVPAWPDAELWSLCSAMCDGTIDEAGLARLESSLEADATNRLFCACYFRMNGQLMRVFRPNAVSRKMVDECGEISSAEAIDNEERPARFGRHFPDLQSATSDSVGEWPNPTIEPTSQFAVLGNAIHGTAGYFSSGWPVAYLVATVVLGLGLLAGFVVHVSEPQVAKQSTLPSPPGRGAGGEGNGSGNSSLSTLPSFVGRITGMVDCRWAQSRESRVESPESGSRLLTLVSLGDKFALASGLMEITYDTGAKVILQGPVTYTLESKDSGYLSVGKLTARLDKKEERTTRKEELSGSRSSFLIPHSYFSVRTPTATVTDLGTEFGVEVNQQGLTTSHVFRGSVRLQVLGVDGEMESGAVVLRKNESAQTEKRAGGVVLAMRRASVDPRTFVRRIAYGPKTLDLLDIVAGGYGTTHRRERGIDATTGMEDPMFLTDRRQGDAKYRPVTWHKLIDGVFTPGGSDEPVVVDSAGHTFGGFPRSASWTDASIWARAANVRTDGQEKNYRNWAYAMGAGRQYMPQGTGLLCLATNMGITFNLEAMRTQYRGMRPAHFRALAAVADANHIGRPEVPQAADIWILVDGQLKLSRTNLRSQDDSIKVDLELGPTDRFLTLVTTRGHDGSVFDWMVYGDPVLEMVSEESLKSGPSGKEVP